MKYNLSAIESSIKANIYKVRDRLHIDLADGEDGKPIRVQKGDTPMLEVKPDEVSITYDKVYQVFYALKVLMQNNKKSYSMPIRCAFEKLGVMIDCSRNGVPNLEFLKDYIFNLVLMGYNEIQLYTEDTYEVEGEPYFGYMRGRYTAAEIREIVAFAEAFDVEVVPCIQTLAHLNQIFRWNRYKKINDIDDILLVDDEGTYELIDKMFATIAKTFKSRRIHIGMDEAHNIGRGKYLTKNGYTHSTELMLRHLNKVVKIAEKYGFECMMWSDMFFRIVNGGAYYASNMPKFSKEVTSLVPKGLKLVYWDYYTTNKGMYDEMFERHADFTNNQTYFAGGAWRWIGFTPWNAASCARTKAAFESATENNVKSFLLTLWGDDGSECSFNAVLPTLCYLSDLAYGDEKHENSFVALSGVSLDDFMCVDLPDTVKSGNLSKVGLYSDCFMGLYDELIRMGEQNKYKDMASKLYKLSRLQNRYAYVFRTLAALCDVLSVKLTLGKQTREAYNRLKTDENVAVIKKQLKKLVAKSYKPLLKKLDVFYEAFRDQWYRENKPFGFEVHDVRIGGLIHRVKHCIYELERYIKGEINVIPELEESLLVPDDGSNPDHILHNRYGEIISAGKVTW